MNQIEALRRLKELSPDSQHPFTADTRSSVISENTMLFALYRMGYHGRQTTHGLRRCASTILNESGEFPPDWIEVQLAHADRNKTRWPTTLPSIFPTGAKCCSGGLILSIARL